jgi:hypothetical protein
MDHIGEVAAVPVLLRRMVAEIAPEVVLDLPRPYRVGRDSLLVPGGIERAVAAVAEHGDGVIPRDRKGWLSRHRTDGHDYRPVADQAALSALFDMALARQNSPSFDKLWRDVERLVTEVVR